MKFFFKHIVAPVYFKQLSNGKWFKIEMLFLYMALATIIAVGRLAYSEPVTGFVNTVWDIVFCLPAIIGFLAIGRTIFFRSIDEVSDISPEYQLTRLALLHKWWFKKSDTDLIIEKRLKKWFEMTYGYKFHEMKMSWMTWAIVPAWIAIAILVMLWVV